MLQHRLQPFSTVTMSLTASRLSGYYTIGERRIKEKCREQRIGKIKSIGIYTVWKFISYTTFFPKAESCRTSSFGEHSLPVLLPSHKQRKAPLNWLPTTTNFLAERVGMDSLWVSILSLWSSTLSLGTTLLRCQRFYGAKLVTLVNVARYRNAQCDGENIRKTQRNCKTRVFNL